VYRAYFKHALLKQYEKFLTFLRNELCSNNLKDFGLKKSLDNLEAVREKFQAITSRFAGFQAQWLNVHVDFPLLQRIALPITKGAVRYPGIKIHETRIIRLMEVLLHGGTHVGGWTAKEIHQAVLATFALSERAYRLNQLNYDLRKLKGHALLERDGSRYAYRLTTKGVEVSLLFLFFHKRLCGPLANSRFHHQPDAQHRPDSRLEKAYHRADAAIQNVVGGPLADLHRREAAADHRPRPTFHYSQFAPILHSTDLRRAWRTRCSARRFHLSRGSDRWFFQPLCDRRDGRGSCHRGREFPPGFSRRAHSADTEKRAGRQFASGGR
jgi:hypothetical protein